MSDAWPFAATEQDAADELDADELAACFARCFAGGDGARALAHLRRLTIERRLDPAAPEALLRHLEGQRHLAARILALVARGRGEGKSEPFSPQP